MKVLAALILAALLTACDTSQEDRDFYYNGWVKPETGSQKRMFGGGSAEGIQSTPVPR